MSIRGSFATIALAIALAVPSDAVSALDFLTRESFRIPSAAMAPTILPGDTIRVDKKGFDTRDPERGDVVVFRNPGDPGVTYVKRIVALPGDEVQMIGGILHLDGKPVARRLVGAYKGADALAPGGGGLQVFAEVLPGGREYRILEVSDQEFLDDTAPFLVPADHYFVLGDNRDNSMDSRLPDAMGYVPRDHLVGPVLLPEAGPGRGRGRRP